MVDSCRWTGASGKNYRYNIHPIDTAFNDVPGNYIFARKSSYRNWQAIYIGETESMKDQLPNDNDLPGVLQNGCTHIHTHITMDSRARFDEETDLLTSIKTPCNG